VITRTSSLLAAFVFTSLIGAAQTPKAPSQEPPPSAPKAEAPQSEPSKTGKPSDAAPPSILKPSSDDAKPAPMTAVDPKTFRIGAEDVIFVQVWREPDFTRQVLVRPDGKVTMPLIGELEASGQTPDQLAARITEALGKYLNSPQVIVTVLQVNSKKYYIDGEVNRPGAFPLAVPTHVLEALANAGGFREFANTKKIVVLRKGKQLKFNYKDVIKGKNQDQNILVENGDHIIVP
jgi:polysaccharide export outer membrane protein